MRLCTTARAVSQNGSRCDGKGARFFSFPLRKVLERGRSRLPKRLMSGEDPQASAELLGALLCSPRANWCIVIKIGSSTSGGGTWLQRFCVKHVDEHNDDGHNGAIDMLCTSQCRSRWACPEPRHKAHRLCGDPFPTEVWAIAADPLCCCVRTRFAPRVASAPAAQSNATWAGTPPPPRSARHFDHKNRRRKMGDHKQSCQAVTDGGWRVTHGG